MEKSMKSFCNTSSINRIFACISYFQFFRWRYQRCINKPYWLINFISKHPLLQKNVGFFGNTRSFVREEMLCTLHATHQPWQQTYCKQDHELCTFILASVWSIRLFDIDFGAMHLMVHNIKRHNTRYTFAFNAIFKCMYI